MIRAIVADDELLARQKLRLLLRAEADVEIVGEATTAAETVDLVRLTGPDLLFLDMLMPGDDGFEILKTLAGEGRTELPRVIFTTAHDCYALRAFEIDAVDYLLKPFTAERLHTAVQRVRHLIRTGAPRDGHDGASGQYTKRIVFKSRGRILFLPVSEIRWIQAEENYVRLCTGSETHMLRETMTHLTERLDPEMFLRIHRSFIVNLHYLKEVRTGKDGEPAVLLADGQMIGVSRSYRSRIRELLHS